MKTARTNQNCFWNQEYFCPDPDEVNESIWLESASVQEGVQPASDLRRLNAFGAQQSMVDPDPESDPPTTCETRLPWAPDLLGRDWMAEEGILIVGSAYAGFVKEYSGGVGMHLRDYLACKTANEFRAHFIEQVVGAFRKYYGFVERLGESLKSQNATFSGFALTDLCKASFVCRMGSDCENGEPKHRGYIKEGRTIRTDEGGDPWVEAAPELYCRYVENPKAMDWTWRRLSMGRAQRIVTLGRIAEHGVLRCFQAHHCQVQGITSRSGEWSRFRNPDQSNWARRQNYAEPKLRLSHWLDEQDWWTVTGNHEGSARQWRILPIKHPSQASVNTEEVKRILKLMAA